ncbi:uncharacterized protein RSE6_06886 [Rhynchosporium secalis]|uniref:Uncharacterized protein n=1 Tax=Rhynchosporium secalis TaxID=38038 RepID=A0A1E1MBJ0_RHYSE|nr:uncharacterized protein RSE6_06886 [Rhynchosporium secalis]
MGAVDFGRMSNSLVAPLRTGLIISVVVFCLIWSLLSLDLHVTSIKIFHGGDQKINSKPQNNATTEHTASVQETSPPAKNTTVIVTVPATDGHGNSTGGHVQLDLSTISNRPLILYAYADSKDGSALANFKFFIAHGLHAAADFIIILNGETSAAALIPTKDNIRVVHRPNTCYDMGAFSEVLQKDGLYKRYKRFITMNASIRGPFMPYWSEGCWSDMFLNLVTDEVKLVGMTANCWPTFHIQSMIWATDLIGITTLLFPPKKALDYLSTHPHYAPRSSSSPEKRHTRSTSPSTIFGINGCFSTWHSAVRAEVSSTSLILASGYKVDALMLAYQGLPRYKENLSCKENQDLLFPGNYFGIDVHPFETVFMKANRDVSPKVLERYSEWMEAKKYSSYDVCKA